LKRTAPDVHAHARFPRQHRQRRVADTETERVTASLSAAAITAGAFACRRNFMTADLLHSIKYLMDMLNYG
jgi:hypothetical protein